jgi:hypothetical protein
VFEVVAEGVVFVSALFLMGGDCGVFWHHSHHPSGKMQIQETPLLG